MAVLNLSVTLADEDVPRLMNAARSVFPMPIDETGKERQLTDEEVIEYLRQHGISLMRKLVRDFEREQARKAAETLEPVLSIS